MAVRVTTASVVAAGDGEAVDDGRIIVAVLVPGLAGSVGGVVIVSTATVCVVVGVVVRVDGYGGAGVRVRADDSPVGVGVSRKIPVTARSVPSPYPFSRRISSKAATFMGAFFSYDQRP